MVSVDVVRYVSRAVRDGNVITHTVVAVEYPSHGPHRCGKCPALWGGHSTCHCSACHCTFGGVSSFDAHRVDGRCVIPANLALDARRIWVKPLPESVRDRWARARAKSGSDSLPDSGAGHPDERGRTP